MLRRNWRTVKAYEPASPVARGELRADRDQRSTCAVSSGPAVSSGLFDVAAQASHPVRRAQIREASWELTEPRELLELSEPAVRLIQQRYFAASMLSKLEHMLLSAIPHLC